MSWANEAIKLLEAGEPAVIHPRGNSMYPLVKSGQRVELEPVEISDLSKWDIILCKVNKRVYLHLVRGLSSTRGALIGNTKGYTNGWASTVYGRMR